MFRSKFTCILLLLMLILLPFMGAPFISPLKLINGSISEVDSFILYSLRIPRFFEAFLVGATLALCGAVLQAIFRNPLADPFLFGISSGAALGASLIFFVPVFSVVSASIASLFGALIGSAVVLIIAIALSGSGKAVSQTLLLVGVAIHFFCSSLILFLQYISDLSGILRMSRWLLGTIQPVDYTGSILIAVLLIPCFLILLSRAHVLDLLSFGEEYSTSKGVDVRPNIILFFAITALLVAVVVSLVGPIGFVGLIVPHIARKLFGELHKALLIYSFLLGGFILAFCDTLARTLASPIELPVGLVTALLGAPAFIVLLCKKPLAHQ